MTASFRQTLKGKSRDLEGGVFLDPFAGSGALPFAAERVGMRAFGFERSVATKVAA